MGMWLLTVNIFQLCCMFEITFHNKMLENYGNVNWMHAYMCIKNLLLEEKFWLKYFYLVVSDGNFIIVQDLIQHFNTVERRMGEERN